MITKTNSFQTSDGLLFESLDAARTHEIGTLLQTDGIDSEVLPLVLSAIEKHGATILEVLTAGPKEPRRKYTRKAKEAKV